MTNGEFNQFSEQLGALSQLVHNLHEQNEQQSKQLEQLCAQAKRQRFGLTTAKSLELWTTQDVADYLGVSYGYVSRNVITSLDFPAAVELPRSKGEQGKNPHKRWIAGQVVAWFERKQELKERAKRRLFRGGN